MLLSQSKGQLFLTTKIMLTRSTIVTPYKACWPPPTTIHKFLKCMVNWWSPQSWLGGLQPVTWGMEPTPLARWRWGPTTQRTGLMFKWTQNPLKTKSKAHQDHAINLMVMNSKNKTFSLCLEYHLSHVLKYGQWPYLSAYICKRHITPRGCIR